MSKTAEPFGGKPSKGKPRFVIQKHQARSLHFDVRIEIDGVMVSWAVPKGPSLNPKEMRLAIRTEDHPIDYADFEGTIPEGEYGAGTVMIWDEGTFDNLSMEKDKNKDKDKSAKKPIPLSKALKEGKIHVWLHGSKLEGGYLFFKSSRPMTPGQEQWFMKKENDDKADARRNPVGTENKSARSGRTMKQIEKAEG